MNRRSFIQTFYTGNTQMRVHIRDRNITEEQRGFLSPVEIAKIQANPNQTVFFRRYGSLNVKP